MASTHALIPTRHGSRYLQQLCKHWAHKLEVDFTPEQGTVKLPDEALTTMTAGPEALEVRIEAPDTETLERMKGVVSRHLDRFAFREAPLPFDWKDAS
ncbi:DUF2218 domain-containing protein [Ancylobacter pratisalsi]|uniref:DUF2218 domain-containing protein n=1 Tax=Ancylobacter pratisalsi TaxID=1745854 RepID=A0A6P1YQT6_9HYPH|nr:DUF2218 domain-containing protein [Ancylobacter pratisalsi]QIB35847.1 DUF2218 domain-containing protein [Ancylobacter pratisalsi]